jgi:hypothetical protein
MRARTIAICLAAAAIAGCSHFGGVVTSNETRIWVLKTGGGIDEVYRCADGAAQDQPPRPVCVRAAVVGEPR